MHRHGQCWRKAADCSRIGLQRYRCPWCRRTASALKAGMLPYRRISATELQQALDEPDLLKQDQVAPSQSLRRAIRTFQRRALRLHLLVGTDLALSLDPVLMARRLWPALRQRFGALATLLVELALKYGTSLLHDYQSLQLRPRCV
jgi:hypothetical protein